MSEEEVQLSEVGVEEYVEVSPPQSELEEQEEVEDT